MATGPGIDPTLLRIDEAILSGEAILRVVPRVGYVLHGWAQAMHFVRLTPIVVACRQTVIGTTADKSGAPIHTFVN